MRSRAKTSLKDDRVVDGKENGEDGEEGEECEEEDEEDVGANVGLLNEGQVRGTCAPTFGFLRK